MSTPHIQKTFCTTREAAALLGVSIGTVQLWVESDLLQAWKTAGGHRRVMRESVDRLLHKSAQVEQPQAKSLAAEKERRLSVLIVEDDPSLLRLYQAKMSRWPIKLDLATADNAVAALLAIGRGGPDLLITDLNMPFTNGFEMLRVLTRAPEAVNTTIVVVSGLDAAEIARRGPVPPGIEVLSKPVPFDRLLAIATGILK
ncbi:MAG: response regulator [Comamonadaceae bacterium]